MSRTQGYCQTTDLLIASNFPMPVGFSLQKYVNDAADEIDIAIGRLYKTPVLLQGAEAMEKYATTLTFLQRLNAHLATGRIIMSIAAPGEDGQLNAYGWSLVQNAQQLLLEIKDGEIVLEGAPSNSNTTDDETVSTPRMVVANLDSESGVEHFYNNILNQSVVIPFRGAGG